MSIILGIDPGSCTTGYGVIQSAESQLTYLDSGCIKLGNHVFSERLKKIFLDLQAVLSRHKPTAVAIEKIFSHINPDAALKLGQARGAAIVTVALLELPISEYSAKQVKQSVVGYGAATKQQVQHMVCARLNLSHLPQSDASDALAIALCHAQSTPLQTMLAQKMGLKQQLRFRRGRLR